MIKKVQSYDILEVVGHGGMGVVYKARHEFSQEIVAIKALAHQYAFDQELRKRFRNEALILRKLKHENIVQVKDFIEEPDCLYIVMEYVEGRTLEHIIGKEVGPIVHDRALPIFRQILDGIEYAHQQGVIHRDIKPGNILVTSDNKVKITDFGIAKMEGLSNLSSTGAKMGTLCYMSPEQLNGEKVDARTDVYSLGMTLYVMLAGRLPFSGRQNLSDIAIVELLSREPLEDPRKSYPAIPEWLVRTVFASLHRVKEKRVQTIPALKELLDTKAASLMDSVPDYAPTLVVPEKETGQTANETVEIIELEPEYIVSHTPSAYNDQVEIKSKPKKSRGIVWFLLSAAIIVGGIIYFNTMNKPREIDTTPLSLNIYKVEIANTNKDRSIIDAYGSKIYQSKTQYLQPKIYYNANKSGYTDLYIKIFGYYGELLTFDKSPSGYTYSCSFYASSSGSEELTGWGNDKKGNWSSGSYVMEIWQNNRMLTTKDIVVEPDYFSVYDVEMGNYYQGGAEETAPGNTLYASNSMYLGAKIYYQTSLEKDITIQTKLYNAQGELSHGDSSPEGYSQEIKITVNGSGSQNLNSWGNKEKGHWPAGNYRIEIYRSDELLYTKHFTIY